LARSKPNFRLGLSWEEYEKKIKEGTFQLHAFSSGFAITQIVSYLEEKVCMVHLIGGERFDEWSEDFTKRIKAFALEHGCKALEGVARLGLEKKLNRVGWKRKRVLMRIDL
jgi:cell division protein YceG involved in septum cleavage